jgi:hypothetical protein
MKVPRKLFPVEFELAVEQANDIQFNTASKLLSLGGL